jgi:hypothetical protein
MDSIDTFRERFEALEQRTEPWQQHTRTVERRLRAALAAVMMAVVMVAVTVMAPSAASASANGCTRIGGSFVGDLICFEVRGSSTTVEYGVVSHHTSEELAATFCNYQGRMTIYNGSGGVIWAANSNYHAGCYGPVYFVTRRIIAYQNFPTARRICGSWFENGSRLGTVCHNIRP